MLRILHSRHGDRWHSESPDVPRWFASTPSTLALEDVCRHAEENVRVALGREDVEVEHFVAASECSFRLSLKRAGEVLKGPAGASVAASGMSMEDVAGVRAGLDVSASGGRMRPLSDTSDGG